MAGSFATVYKWLVPSWLSSGDGGLALLALATLLDETSTRIREGLEARMPSRAGTDALALIGADRSIRRGRDETDAHYAERLLLWRYPRGHRVRGGAFALLEQISEYFGGLQAYTIDRSGNRFTRTADGTESVAHGLLWAWGAAPASSWSRFWVVVDLISGPALFTPTPDWGDVDLWGGALDVAGYCVGFLGATPYDVRAIRELMSGQAWRPAGTQPEWLVLFGVDGGFTLFPTALYERWSKVVAGVRSPARPTAGRYISFDPEHNNRYAGNPEQFTNDVAPPGGGSSPGDSTSFPATITLPGGSSYVGDPTSFPVATTLVDDGDG